MSKFLPKAALDLEKLITVATHADGENEMSAGGFLLSIACSYGTFECFQTLLDHNAKIDGHVIEKVFTCDDHMNTKNQHKGRIQILDYLIETGFTSTIYEHCRFGKCNAIWLCAGFGAP